MTHLRGISVAIAAVAALAFAALSLAATPNAPSIQIVKGGFSPAAVTINAGGSITILNKDTVDHTLSAPAVGLAMTTLHPDDNVAQTFPTAGKFTITDSTGLALVVNVTAAEIPTVHLNLQPKAVVFGTWLKVRGKLDPVAGANSVSIKQQPCGSQKFTTAKTVRTDGGGAFIASLRPKSNTVYQVQVGSSKATVAAHVSPKLVLRKQGGGKFMLAVNGPATGSAVSIQTRTGGHWTVITTVKVTGVTKQLALDVKPGTMLRASMNTHQAGQCLDAGISNEVIA